MTLTSSPEIDLGVREYDQLIDGTWTSARSGATFDSLNPLDGSVFARVPASSRTDMADAVAAADRAQPKWSAMSPSAKQALFLRAAELLEQRSQAVVQALATETGAGFGFAMYQMTWSAQLLRLAAGWVFESKGKILTTDHPHTMQFAERKPLGVVASFSPWNGANLLAWRAVVAPLAAGNTVVLKPSEEAPVTGGVLIAQVLHDAGFPAGVINVVTHAAADAAAVSEEFYENPAVRCLYFTGSAATAKIIAARAGAALKRTVLELGGYNHMMVLDDADLDHAAKLAAFSSFFHQGQTCMSARRILVQRSVYDEFLAKFSAVARSMPMGDPSEPDTIFGPLINDRAAGAVRARIDDAVNAGARIFSGGVNDGRMFEPTIIVDAPDENDLSCEETFGPVVVVRPIDNDDEGVELANASRYGLSFSVVTGDTSRGMAVASRINSGAVHVNGPTIDDEPHLPNGGTKESGWGRSGPDALNDFSELRWMSVELGTRNLPF
ncbi:aldehyde dehydrogenase family protein [Amycolatopsis sp. NPDC001319]|uniref:aldehyde dehydrogenase family protein n=1 Tax=unclassified Amycolatopsis TaxID=2618356 RepID=UPI0036CB38E9